MSRSGEMPAYAKPCADGSAGGLSNKIGADNFASAGAISRISPHPWVCASISMSELIGHPPPGNSADRDGYPVSTVEIRPRANCDARQSDG
jgi:hypothetical protein